MKYRAIVILGTSATLLLAAVVLSPSASACHGDCGPGQNACAQACGEGGMGGMGFCVDSAPGDGYQTNWGWGKRNGNGACGGWGNCLVRQCYRDFECNGGFTKVGGGGDDSNGPDGYCRPSCSANAGNSCQSGANACGMRNSGTIQCSGACNASPPPNNLCPAPTCSAGPAQVALGATVTATAASGVPGYTWNSGGGSPATGVGASRTFTYASAGAKTITVTDSNAKSGTCAVTVCVANWNQTCVSAANACGMTGSGTVQCNGSCTAVVPPPSACPPPTCSANPSSVNGGQPVTATGAGGIPPYTWSSGGLPPSGSGNTYTLIFDSIGAKTITVRDSNAKTGTCNVNVGATYTATGTVSTSQGGLPNLPGITFSTAYTVRVIVWDADDRQSAPADFPYTTKPGPWPTADFTFSPARPFAAFPMQFTDATTPKAPDPSRPTSWSWSFGDGQGDTIQNPIHTYATEGSYSVTLQATNAAGTCSVTKSLTADKPLPRYREVRPGSPSSPLPTQPTATRTEQPITHDSPPGQPVNDGR